MKTTNKNRIKNRTKNKIQYKIKNKEHYLLYAVLLLAVIVLIFSIISFLNFQGNNADQQLTRMHSATRMSLTVFDKQLAREFMDKDNDGRCDSCGMDVNMCIDGGQLQCNMDPSSTIGILGSAHIHVDFKVFINGEAINFANSAYYMKSSFIHLDEDENKEKASSVLHMHAKGVPLWVFFESIGMKLNKTCLAIDGKNYCNDGKSTLKFYVNGKLSNEYGNYVFRHSDKILISYGNETDLSQQFNSINNFSEEHKNYSE